MITKTLYITTCTLIGGVIGFLLTVLMRVEVIVLNSQSIIDLSFIGLLSVSIGLMFGFYVGWINRDTNS
jgi:hypothetical protein